MYNGRTNPYWVYDRPLQDGPLPVISRVTTCYNSTCMGFNLTDKYLFIKPFVGVITRLITSRGPILCHREPLGSFDPFLIPRTTRKLMLWAFRSWHALHAGGVFQGEVTESLGKKRSGQILETNLLVGHPLNDGLGSGNPPKMPETFRFRKYSSLPRNTMK